MAESYSFQLALSKMAENVRPPSFFPGGAVKNAQKRQGTELQSEATRHQARAEKVGRGAD